MKIPDGKIDEVRSSSDIVEIISSFVNLKKRGKNYVGLCPFHSEKTPSFTVSADKQMYHCFGCGVGGNVFTFVMEHEKVSFVEAVRYLADRAGIQLAPSQRTPEAISEETETETLYAVSRFAGLFFYKNLTASSEGRVTLDYFHTRGWMDETVKRFGLGHSLNEWDGLLRHAQESNIGAEDLERCGLVIKRDDGSCYDRFRGRAMFPIFSASGRVVGFGARRMMDDENTPKYINSPETKIYNKSRVLYGLFQAKDALRQEDNAILVEGYADLISVFQAGVQNVVASSGTALTEEQILLLARYTKNVTVVYDADSAGSKATIRGVDLILGQGLNVKVVELPQGEDPDSYVKKYGSEKFRRLVDKAISFVEFTARAFQREGKLDTPEGQTGAVRSIIETIAKIQDPLKRQFYVKDIAERYKLYESVLYRELEKQLRVNRPRAAKREANVRSGNRQLAASTLSDAQSGTSIAGTQPSVNNQGEIPAAERDLIKLMLEGSRDVVDYVFARISVDDFEDDRAKSIAIIISNTHKQGERLDINALLNQLSDQSLKGVITNLLLRKYELSKGWHDISVELNGAEARKIADGAIVTLRRREIERRIDQNQKALREASRIGEDVTGYLERHQQLLQEKQLLETKPLAQRSNSVL